MMSEPTVCVTNIGPKESHKRLVMGICIGVLNHLFSGPSNIAGPVGCQSSFCLMKIPMLLGRLGRRAVGGARSVPIRRLALATGFRLLRLSGINRIATRERGGARVGRHRWARILTITGGSSMADLRRGSGQAMI